MNFPNGFKEKYQHLGEDAAVFCDLDQEAVSAFGQIPRKKRKKHLMIRFHNTLGTLW